MSTENLNLFKALAAARRAAGTVGRSQSNDYDGYKYADYWDYLQAIDKPCDEAGLLLTFNVESVGETACKTARGKDATRARVSLAAELVHVESGETKVYGGIPGEGIDLTDKSIPKAITGAKKVAVGLIFNLATGDEPEATTDGRNDPIATAVAELDLAAALLQCGTVEQFGEIVGGRQSISAGDARKMATIYKQLLAAKSDTFLRNEALEGWIARQLESEVVQ